MLEHFLILKDRQAGFLGKDLSHNIFQQMSDFKGDRLVLTLHCGHDADLVIVKLSRRPVGG